MKKKLNVAGIVNELTGQSAFFRGAQKAAERKETPDQAEDTTVRKSERISERKSERTENRSVAIEKELPARRMTKRYSFELYADQINKLKILKNKAEEQGLYVPLSAMAREALDLYLKDKKI